MPLVKLENEQGYLKAGFLGYQKSGKSFTACVLAIGTRKYFGLKEPIAFFDTESGSGYVAKMVREQTGTDLLGVRARSFAELMQFCKDCIENKVSVAIVDSITHPWRELCDSYLADVNKKRLEKGSYALQKLEFQHWAAIKAMWQPWSDFFLNSPLHMIVCGRAGAIWEMEKNDETGRKELIQTGTKMKVEGEFGFEPSLLVEMERDQRPDGKGGQVLFHSATVLGDRFNVLDGRTETNPTFEFFKPHVEQLKPGTHATVNVSTRTQTGADIEGYGDWEREKRKRTIFCEEIQGEIVAKYPGQSAEDKKTKADLLQKFFGTRSWTKIESMDSDQLKNGLNALRAEFGVSNNGTDDGDLGPKLPQDASGGINTAPAAEKSPVAEDGAQIQAIRFLIKGQKMVESRLLGMLGELGTVPPGTQTLEQVEPEARNRIIENWVSFTKAYVDSQSG